jgi:hypothetical protein
MMLRAPRLPFSLDPLIAEAKQRARRRWLSVALIVALLAGGTAAALALHSSGPSGASPLTGPQGVLGSMVAAALGQKSVHWTQTGAEDLQGRYRLSSDVTADSGVQRFTGLPGGGQAEIRLVNGVVYVRGNPRGLLPLTNAQAARYVGRWISIPKSDKLYTRVSDGLTLASLVHDVTSLDASTPLNQKAITRMSHGMRVLVFKEGEPAGAYLSVSTHASGERLPIAVTVSYGPGGYFDGSFSKWNEPVHPTAPSQAVPIATVRRS